ncbi:hypothetical protein C8J57DRAFT_1648364 [Mycena rebaudengoi]|jgi:hypothetical protein|nr:hypothetical protein C8J57DRAFT_1648364 [Mycena rebaudengoi]
MEADGLGSHQVYPATPEHPVPNEGFPLPMPWTNIIPNVTPEFRAAALAREVMHGIYEEQYYTFYFIDLTFAQPPFIVLTYWKVADGADTGIIKAALIEKLLKDPVALDAAKEHDYLPNETKPDVLLRTIVELATFRPFTYFLQGSKRTVWSIIMPPLSTNPVHTAAFQRHLMESPAFFFDVEFLGTALPWRGPKGDLMSCSACHSIDHYRQDCPIINSDEYTLRRGIHLDLPSAWKATSKLPTSLTDEMDTSESVAPPSRMGFSGYGRGRGGRGSDRTQGGFNSYREPFRGGRGSRYHGSSSRAGGNPY